MIGITTIVIFGLNSQIAGEPCAIKIKISPEWQIKGCICDRENNCTIDASQKDGTRYKGHIQYGLFHGYGRIEESSGLIYEGTWYEGKRKGKGKYRFSDGSEIAGNFYDGEQTGYGEKKWPDGRTYSGQIQRGKTAPFGAILYPDGGQYKGQIDDGTPSGKGRYVFPDGREYIGIWLDGKTSGIGKMGYPDGTNYIGEWKDGLRNGKGVYMFADGRVAQGTWVSGEMQGDFLLQSDEGKIIKATYKDGVQISQKRIKKPIKYFSVWDASLEHDEDEIGRQSVRLYIHYDNELPVRIIGVQVSVKIKNSFGKTVYKNTFEDETLVEPFTKKKSDTFWTYEDNPYINGQVYDRLWPLARNGTSYIECKILKIITSDRKILR